MAARLIWVTERINLEAPAMPRPIDTLSGLAPRGARHLRPQAEAPYGPVHESPTRVAGAAVLGASLKLLLILSEAHISHHERTLTGWLKANRPPLPW